LRRSVLLALAVAPAFLFASVAPAAAVTPAGVTVSGSWVKASEYSDHVGGMTGVFAKITNKSKKTITLVGGTSSFAPMVDVHQVVNGVMSHKPGGVTIAPGKTAILEPGGLHVMLMGLTKKILPGTKVDLKLTFKGANPVALKLTAKSVAAGAETYSPAPMSSPSMTPNN
jgi:periplasmic copper chaperone A